MNDLKVLIQREKIAERVGQLGADITRDSPASRLFLWAC